MALTVSPRRARCDVRVRLPPCCTAGAACGYATGVGGSATVTLAGAVHGFPAALTSFIGREGPLREVAGLLAEYRLVTVTGPGGVRAPPSRIRLT